MGEGSDASCEELEVFDRGRDSCGGTACRPRRRLACCPLCMRTEYFAGLLLFVVLALPGVAGSTSLSPDFINIDCGYTGLPYQNGTLTWTTDRFFSGGYPTLIYNLPLGVPAVKMQLTLRYFKEENGRRNCYNISVTKPGRYLVRLTFYYNNYDGQGSAPIFNVSVGTTACGTIRLNTGNILSPEYILDVETPYILICLLRIFRNPIINGIEIRPLPSESYGVSTTFGYTNTTALVGKFRFACGEDITVGKFRYPEDPLDRIWFADINDDQQTIRYGTDYFVSPPTDLPPPLNTTKNITGAMTSPNYVPQFVLQSARLFPNTSDIKGYIFLDLEHGDYQAFFYFAEIAGRNIMAYDRMFGLYINNASVEPNIDIVSIADGPFRSVMMTYPILHRDQADLYVEFRPLPDSLLMPMVNGFELLKVQPGPIPTDPLEVLAMQAFRDALSDGSLLSDWVGDPCSPIEWFGVTCQSSTPFLTKVTAINVSSSGLTGTISPFLANISSLQILDLSYNGLEGPIPDSLGDLEVLEVLHLQSNELNGSVPSSLQNLLRLKDIDLSSNLLSGAFPLNETNFTPKTVNLSANQGLCTYYGVYGLPTCEQFPPPPDPFSSPIPQSAPSPPFAGPEGGSPPPSPPPSGGLFTTSPGLVAGVVASGVIVALAIVMVVVLCLLRVRRGGTVESGIAGLSPPGLVFEGGGLLKPLVGFPASAVVPRVSGSRQFTLDELRDATGGFSLSNQIGVGGFGIVFKGILVGGKVVAVKKRIGTSLQGHKEFYNEVELLSRVHHRHLVSLIGFCNDGGQQILVYEYMPNGTVRDHLYDMSGKPMGKLEWQRRLSIAVGAAKGIEYLHTGSNPCIIHRDIKTSNILLDENYEAKVADFGLSKLGPEGGESHVSTMVKGTAGYLDPEYYTIQQLTDRSDVYSFGVVLLELICGREPINLNRARPEWSLVEWVRPNLQQGNLQAVLDPTLEAHQYSLDAMWKVAEIGILCVEPAGQNRPCMSDVLRELKEAMEMEGFSIRDSLGSAQHQLLDSSSSPVIVVER